MAHETLREYEEYTKAVEAYAKVPLGIACMACGTELVYTRSLVGSSIIPNIALPQGVRECSVKCTICKINHRIFLLNDNTVWWPNA